MTTAPPKAAKSCHFGAGLKSNGPAAMVLSWRARYGLRRLTLNLERDPVKTNGPQDIEHTNDVAVDRVTIAANEYLGVRIGLVDLRERRGQFVIRHLLLVEV